MIEQVDKLLANEISIRDFYSILQNHDTAGALAKRLDLLFSEYTSGHLEKAELLQEIERLRTAEIKWRNSLSHPAKS